MKKSSFVLIVLNVAAMCSGALLLARNGQRSEALAPAQFILPGPYDVLHSADVNGDGQITASDTLYVKSCVGETNTPIAVNCRGQWQQMTPNPPDGVVKYQKVGRADINGDDRVNLSDVLYAKSCVGRPAGDPCHGELRRRRIISGRVVDASGKGVAGVGMTAIGVDADGDPAP